jgi:hypothetical protein
VWFLCRTDSQKQGKGGESREQDRKQGQPVPAHVVSDGYVGNAMVARVAVGMYGT